jgi:PAS domain S-box-containing protein
MSKLTILIVEDEAIVAEDLSERVGRLGYEVAGVVRSGEDAIEFVRRERPALVLMDVRLAGKMDGVTAAMEIHRKDDLPVVFLTAHSDETTVKRAQQADAFGYILKPFEVLDLRIQIEMAIHKHAAERRLRASAEDQRARREELEALMESIPTAIFIARDAQCQSITGNPAAMELLRMTAGSNPSKTPGDQQRLPDYEVWIDGRQVEARELPMQQATATGRMVQGAEAELVFPDGSRRHIIGSAMPLFDETGNVRGCVASFTDITARKREAEELRRVNRTLRALAASNRAQLLAKSEPDLLHEVCRILTEECGYSMVWIGYAENDSAKSVRPMAHVGFEEGYLETLRISWADTERGRGPTGTAIRSGQACQCANMLTDPLFEPWRAEAFKRGYASSLAVPLLEEGTALGAITIYSGLPAGFAHDEVKLIGNLAQDVAFGITTLRLRRARQQAEAQLSSLNRELENRVQERTAKLNETVAALEAEIFHRHRLEREILEISEREQRRLGSDLHDGLGQELSGIAILGDVLAKQLGAQNNPLADTADKMANYVRAALDSTRLLAKGNYPIELECHGLRLALQDLARQTSRRTRIHCELRHNGAEPVLEKSAEIHIYRIIQECIGNAVKHAMPKHIIIESQAGDGEHSFSVTDDGCGFAVPADNPGMGLHLMRYRARVIGAKLTIDQPQEGGCRVTCRLREEAHSS